MWLTLPKRLRLLVYRLLSVESGLGRSRIFRFGLPFVIKITKRIHSTEADALRYLNSQFQGANRIPIPYLYDSIVLDGVTYSLISKIPGKRLWDAMPDLADAPVVDYPVLCGEIEAVMRRVWSLKQPSCFGRQVMISASGHGMPTPTDNYAGLCGPYPNRITFYGSFTHYGTKAALIEEVSLQFGDVEAIFEADRLVFTHPDLRLHNVLITDDGHLSGIIDWEDAGWVLMERQMGFLLEPHPLMVGPFAYYWQAMDYGPEARKAREVVMAAWDHHLALAAQARVDPDEWWNNSGAAINT